MKKITLPNGAKIKLYDKPPDDFDPWNAADRLLIKHGLPKKPSENKAHLKIWNRLKYKKFKYIIPEFNRR